MLGSTTWHLLRACLCLDVVMAIRWCLRLLIILLQSKRLMRPVVYHTRCFCISVGPATEQIMADGLRISAAIDAPICAEPPSCNGACCIVEQASRATQKE
jgi:hypothetical protein